MKAVTSLCLFFIAFWFLGCGDEGVITPEEQDLIAVPAAPSVPIVDILQWRRVPHKDIMLQVPDHLVYESPVYFDTVEEMNLFNNRCADKSHSHVLSSRFVMSADRIYLTDISGMHIHAFDFDGVLIEKEKMSRLSISVRLPKDNGGFCRTTYDSSLGFVINDDGDTISQIISHDGGKSLITWFLHSDGEHQRNEFQPARDGDVLPVFYMEDLMYTLERGLHNHLPNFILYGYNPFIGDRFRTITLEAFIIDRPFFVTSKAFVTEEHIYISYWTEENGKDFNVWTKNGKYIGKCDVVRDFNALLDDETYGMGAELHQKTHPQVHRNSLGSFHYNSHSHTLYAFDGFALSMRKHRYVLRAFQEGVPKPEGNMVEETLPSMKAETIAGMKVEPVDKKPIAEEPTIDEMPPPITIGSFGFGNAEDVFKNDDVITYFEYVNRWAKETCKGARNPLHVFLFDFPDRAEATAFQRLLGANLIIGDIENDIIISDDVVYLNPSDPCAFQIDISP